MSEINPWVKCPACDKEVVGMSLYVLFGRMKNRGRGKIHCVSCGQNTSISDYLTHNTPTNDQEKP